MFPSAPPPNHHVRFALKSSVRFTPPSTPPKSPSLIYPQIAKSDLPSNRLYDLPPPKLPSPIYPQIVKYDLPPIYRQVRFTPPKSPSPIYPQIAKSDLPSNHLYDLPPPEIAKSDLPSNRQVRFTPQIVCTIYPPPPEIAKSDLPSNRQVRFTPPQIVCTIYPPSPPQIDKSILQVKSSVRFTLKLSVWPPISQVWE